MNNADNRQNRSVRCYSVVLIGPRFRLQHHQHHRHVRETASNIDLPRTPEPSLHGGAGAALGTGTSDTDSRWSDRLMPRAIVNRWNAKNAVDEEEQEAPADGIEKLWPNNTNRFDAPPKVRLRVEKRDRKALRNRLRRRRKAELKALARAEAKSVCFIVIGNTHGH